MKKLSWTEVQELHSKNELAGCYKLYDDGTEVCIDRDYDWEEILGHYENYSEFGIEL